MLLYPDNCSIQPAVRLWIVSSMDASPQLGKCCHLRAVRAGLKGRSAAQRKACLVYRHHVGHRHGRPDQKSYRHVRITLSATICSPPPAFAVTGFRYSYWYSEVQVAQCYAVFIKSQFPPRPLYTIIIYWLDCKMHTRYGSSGLSMEVRDPRNDTPWPV